MITGKTSLLGVIGYPISHSLSPVMHNAAIDYLGLDYVYVPFSIAPEHLSTAVAGLAAIGLRGFNVTIPHKQAIMPLLTAVSPLAQAVGAVNTVWWTDTGWHGTNTDVAGFLSPLRSQERNWTTTGAVVLGNGGAARAVVAGCRELGCAHIQVVGRDPQKLQAFADSWAATPIADRLSIHPWETLPSLLPTAGLVVNTTPIGMAPQVDASPLETSALDALQPGTIVYDLIYTPRPTLLLRQAVDRGAIVLDGLEMLVRQGAAALEIWIQQPAPPEIMGQALLTYLA
ncbi:MAG: shikimate dehydrogenase [Cyanobacteria bacterium]|nr:shikimate dehydrogenase [Cyanobacteriota bacterium]MDW8201295.1 shikimate dehydrogenase [Cyanobacteriota bacterium SKYGB_h_bin112]